MLPIVLHLIIYNSKRTTKISSKKYNIHFTKINGISALCIFFFFLEARTGPLGIDDANEIVLVFIDNILSLIISFIYK